MNRLRQYAGSRYIERGKPISMAEVVANVKILKDRVFQRLHRSGTVFAAKPLGTERMVRVELRLREKARTEVIKAHKSRRRSRSAHVQRFLLFSQAAENVRRKRFNGK